MRYLDRIDAGVIERLRDHPDAVGPVHMQDRMHSVSERDILYVERLGNGIESHAAALPACCTITSAAAFAAEVMMSRLPAYLGR